jgi:drug/metabolite transporter (DMT)-like permease
MKALPQYLQAVFWMFGTLIALSLMGIAARELSEIYNTVQILFVRNVVGFAVILALMLQLGTGIVRTQRVWMHGWRNLCHISAVGCWFYGISVLPLAEVFVLESTLPIWVVILAVPFLRERFTSYRLVAVLLGFAGILVILRPGVAIIDPVALIVLLGAMLFGGANVFTKALTRTEGPMTILFWMFLVQLLMASVAISSYGIFLPHGHYWLWVIAIGLTGLAAHYCTACSLSLADAGLVTPLHYLRVPLIAWLGWLIYDETADIWLWIGAGIIFAGTMVNVRGEKN